MSTSAAADTPNVQGPLGVSSLGFAQSQVDASNGGAAVAANWTVTDADPTATNVVGQIQLQMAGARPGTYVGQTYTVDYQVNQSLYNAASYVSGNVASSTYTYSFAVPKYAGTPTARWVINKITVKDDKQHSMTLTGYQLHRFANVLTATETVDSVNPSVGTVTYRPVEESKEPFLYAGIDNYAVYDFFVQEWNSGIWKGAITLAGPGGATLSSAFEMSTLDGQVSTYPCQGFSSTNEVQCDLPVPVAKGTAAGVWSVSQITITSNAGVTTTFGSLDAAPITITDDIGLTASGFSVSPSPADNWWTGQTVNLTLTASGASQGVSAIYVGSNSGTGNCLQRSTTPTVGADGSLSVPLSFASGTTSCPITGIAVVDGAGDVALYGSDYTAPDPNVTITRTPDTTPPSVLSASVSPASIAQSAISAASVVVSVQAAVGVAPINQSDIRVYDSSGNVVDGSFGGQGQGTDGSLRMDVPLQYGQAPGTYTIGFTLTDAGGLSTSYGTPGGLPMPGGPLQITVTAG